MDWVRYRVGFYGSTRTYHGVFAQHGLEELGLKLHKMSLAGEWDKLAAEVSDDVVHLFAAVGTYDTIPGAIAERFGGVRSEERRVGKECVSTCRSRWSPDHYKKKIKHDRRGWSCVQMNV